MITILQTVQNVPVPKPTTLLTVTVPQQGTYKLLLSFKLTQLGAALLASGAAQISFRPYGLSAQVSEVEYDNAGYSGSQNAQPLESLVLYQSVPAGGWLKTLIEGTLTAAVDGASLDVNMSLANPAEPPLTAESIDCLLTPV